MASGTGKQLTHDDYDVAIVCALEVEMSAVRYMLDEEHIQLPPKEGDSNNYICGEMSGHNVVIAYLPHGSQGVGAAAVVATDTKRTFPKASHRLLVGIGGGVPNQRNDIRLGDVVIGMPDGVHGGVVQYDLGRETSSGFERKGYSHAPPVDWQTCVVRMQSDHRTKDNLIAASVDRMIEQYRRLYPYSRPHAASDVLFMPTTSHKSGELTCRNCDWDNQIVRPPREHNMPRIFHGLIASGNRVLKDARVRDHIAENAGGALCFEMEAAGLTHDFGCLVIRGIVDYADSHKSDQWHHYGAAAAAGCAKELLTYIEPTIGINRFGRNEHWLVDRIVNPNFVGRATEVATLVNLLRSAVQSRSTGSQCRIVITGIGGQGKSEVSLQVANQVRSVFWGVFWVDVSTATSAESGFLAIGRQLKPPADDIEGVRQQLANKRDQWLLILDNADDVDVDYAQYFPTGHHGTILLTSRDPNCRQYASQPVVSLEDLTPKEACVLLRRAAYLTSETTDECDVENVAIGLLNGHPLAITQAGAYMTQCHCSIIQYPAVFERQRNHLLNYSERRARSRYGNVYATFEASAEVLESSPDQTAQDALDLLSTLGMFAPSQLPLATFHAARKYADRVTKKFPARSRSSRDGDIDILSPWHVSNLRPNLVKDSEERTTVRLAKAIQLLEAYSLIVVAGTDESTRLTIHPLIHAWAKDRQNQEIQNQFWLGAACLMAVVGISDRRDVNGKRSLSSHVSALLSKDVHAKFDLGPQIMILRILIACGHLLYDLVMSKELFRIGQQILDYLQLDIEVVDARFLPLYKLFGQNLEKLGRVKQTLVIYEQIFKIEEKTLDKYDSNRLSTQHRLAGLYISNGQVRQATEMLEMIAQIDEQERAETDANRLDTQISLANAYLDSGEIAKAIKMLENVVRIEEQVLALPENHPSRLASQHELAGAYLANGETVRAIEMLQRVVRVEKRMLAEEHRDRLHSEYQLGRAYLKSGENLKAIETLEHVVQVEKRTLAEEHPHRLYSQYQLAKAYLKNGQDEMGQTLLEHVREIQRRTASSDHRDRITSESKLAAASTKMQPISSTAVDSGSMDQTRTSEASNQRLSIHSLPKEQAIQETVYCEGSRNEKNDRRKSAKRWLSSVKSRFTNKK